MSASVRQLFLPGSFVISCGSVPIDIQMRKVLLIRNEKNGYILLPKGRKEVGETLEAAAMRETYEETGYECKLMPLRMESRVTGSLKDFPITEPFAMSQRPVRARIRMGDSSAAKRADSILKVIFWFVAEVDSSVPQIQGTQMPSENFTPVWAAFDQAIDALTYEDDKQIVAKALELVQHKISETEGSSSLDKTEVALSN